jgi:iron complex outermembrane receptor protein
MYKSKRKMYDICFSKWNRKPYAVFNTLHKIVKIGVLCVGMLTGIHTVNNRANAQEMAPEGGVRQVVELEEIVVVGQREDALPNVVRTLTALGRDEVDRAPVTSVNDLLRTLPSVDLRQRGPQGVQADLSVRGGSFDQTQVLLNGVNFSDPQTGHYSLDLPVDLSAVSRMEILQGLSAPGAIGGALNIATAGLQSLRNTARLEFSGGRYGSFNVLGNAVAGDEKRHSFLAASRRQSTGYVDNTDFRTVNLYHFTRYRSAVGEWEFQSGFQEKACGAHGFYSFRYPDQFDYTRTLLGSLRWRKEVKNLRLSVLACRRRHYNRFELFRNEAPDWYEGHNYHQTLVNGAEASLGYRSTVGQTSLGAEFRTEEILSTVLGRPLERPERASFEGDVLYTNRARRSLFRGLLSHGYERGRVALNVGVSFHHSNDYGFKSCFAGNAAYGMTPFLIVYTAVHQSLRLPTFTDLYYKSATHEANPQLKPEEAVSCEAGVRTAKKAWRATATIFYRREKNTIDWVYTEGASVSKSLNYGRINAGGVELACRWTPPEYRPKSIIRQAGFHYTFTKPDRENAPQTTSYALDYLIHKLHLNLEHAAFFRKLNASWHFTLYDRAGAYVDPVSGQTAPFEPFVLVDVRLRWNAERYDLFAEANNLLNVAYFDYAGLPQPKLWLTAGIALKFRPAI